MRQKDFRLADKALIIKSELFAEKTLKRVWNGSQRRTNGFGTSVDVESQTHLVCIQSRMAS